MIKNIIQNIKDTEQVSWDRNFELKGIFLSLFIFLNATTVNQNYCNILVRHSLVAPNAFVKVMKVMYSTGMGDTKLAWYSLSVTQQICLNSLEHDLRINGFRPTWYCQIINIFLICAKFLKPSDYYSVINCIFELVMHKFPN